jgi:long-chain acyl-CoA synthetase
LSSLHLSSIHLIGDRRQTSATQDLALSYSLSPSISQIGCAMVTTLAEILPHAARIHGDRIALIVDDRQFSFRELDAMSNRVASGLAAIGINPGDRVSLFGPNSWEWLVSYYGIVKTGAVVNPLSSMLTPDEVRYSVIDAGARAVVASSDKAGTLLPMKGLGNLTDVVCWAEAPIEGARLLSHWLQPASPDFSARRREASDLAAICDTSGTTGRPKGAMQSHRAVVGAATGTALMAAWTADDRVVTALPLFHVYGSSVFNAAMIAGSTLILIPRFNEVSVLSAIQRYRATLMDGVPTAYYYLLAHPDFRQIRSLQPHPLLGGRADVVVRQIVGVHRAHRLSGVRSLGHDGARRRHQRKPGLRPEQARNHWSAVSGQCVPRRRCR